MEGTHVVTEFNYSGMQLLLNKGSYVVDYH